MSVLCDTIIIHNSVICSLAPPSSSSGFIIIFLQFNWQCVRFESPSLMTTIMTFATLTDPFVDEKEERSRINQQIPNDNNIE